MWVMGPHAWAKEGTSMNPAKTSRKNIINNPVFLTATVRRFKNPLTAEWRTRIILCVCTLLGGRNVPRHKKQRLCGCRFKGKAFKPTGIPMSRVDWGMLLHD